MIWLLGGLLLGCIRWLLGPKRARRPARSPLRYPALSPEQETVREARARYFDENGLSEDGYRARWFTFYLGPIPVTVPNTRARVRAVMLHDLHHVATRWPTTWRGEIELGAWELAGGCGRHWPAWLFKLGAAALGILIAPRRTYLAFVRGRHSTNLFHREFGDDLLDLTVADLRRRIGWTQRDSSS